MVTESGDDERVRETVARFPFLARPGIDHRVIEAISPLRQVPVEHWNKFDVLAINAVFETLEKMVPVPSRVIKDLENTLNGNELVQAV